MKCLFVCHFFINAIVLNSFLCLGSSPIPPGPVVLKDFERYTNQIEEKNLALWLEHFVARPHPFGSQAQDNWIKDVVHTFKSWGISSEVQVFHAKVPRRDVNHLQQVVTGRNLLFKIPGKGSCWGVLGGHFDTKQLMGKQLPSANDGGSSTALLLELVRVLHQENQAGLPCTLWVVLFDGEESVLDPWELGQRLHGARDNLYGSRHFVHSLKEGAVLPQWSLVVDMVGHKKQKLSLTGGSWPPLTERLLALASKHEVDVTHAPHLTMEDDHTPFAQASIPFVHMIDWTNTREWHTPQDTLAIISTSKIKKLGGLILELVKNLPLGTTPAKGP